MRSKLLSAVLNVDALGVPAGVHAAIIHTYKGPNEGPVGVPFLYECRYCICSVLISQSQ